MDVFRQTLIHKERLRERGYGVGQNVIITDWTEEQREPLLQMFRDWCTEGDWSLRIRELSQPDIYIARPDSPDTVVIYIGVEQDGILGQFNSFETVLNLARYDGVNDHRTNVWFIPDIRQVTRLRYATPVFRDTGLVHNIFFINRGIGAVEREEPQ